MAVQGLGYACVQCKCECECECEGEGEAECDCMYHDVLRVGRNVSGQRTLRRCLSFQYLTPAISAAAKRVREVFTVVES
jgi:hypothetical protein